MLIRTVYGTVNIIIMVGEQNLNVNTYCKYSKVNVMFMFGEQNLNVP
jgi:hypothetical protein